MQNPTTFIYAICEDGTEFVKFGIACSPKARLFSLQTGNPRKLILKASWPGTLADERKIHRALSGFRAAGEWFLLPSDILAEILLNPPTATIRMSLRPAFRQWGKLPLDDSFRLEPSIQRSRSGNVLILRERCRFAIDGRRPSWIIARIPVSSVAPGLLKSFQFTPLTEQGVN